MTQQGDGFRDRDLPSRLAGVGIIFLASGFFLPTAFVVAAFATVAYSEARLYGLRRRAAEAGQPPDPAFSVALMGLASAAMMANCALLALQGGVAETVLALAILIGALTHTMLIKEHSFAERLAKLGPLIATALFLPAARSLNGAPAMQVLLFAFIIAFLLLYLSLAYRVNQRLKAEMAQARARAEAANRAKDDFLAVISHEIRTPLNGVLGAVQLLQEEEDPDRRKRQLDLLERSARDAERIVTELLDSAKIESGHFSLASEVANLAQTCGDVVDLFRGLAEDKGLDLAFRVDPALPQDLMFDRMRVRQCVSNLLSNALKYTDDGGVELWAGRAPGEPGKVEVRVKDSGPGIAREDQARIFEKYQQIQPAARSTGAAGPAGGLKLNSTGLGLPITRQLARRMGGDVTLRSRPGRGSEFCLSFEAQAVARPVPAAGEAVTPSRDMKAAVATLDAGAHVLVVDDNRTNRTIALAFLRRMGLTGAEACDGLEGLAALEAARFDLVLLDLNMPRMGGAEMFAAMQAAGGRIAATPVIALSAEDEEEAAARIRTLGMADYVPKPIDKAVLEARVAKVIGAARATAGSSAEHPADGGREPATPRPMGPKPALPHPGPHSGPQSRAAATSAKARSDLLARDA
ncbi:hybrid sensor histidine kinase/response regulator [Pseudoruegeria sp. SHC-113]|uniref:ATP-binding response regulator n=1 Tax=Pseudoruegeria sp. SHC-113 TaxID=2855439 RepID=UPI0021BB670D|nr:response regulator [Pseudoruegeria sp. SHC-113]MCT8159312.1 response regulator [Pseudoruegeria sp. SHC-113]